MTGEQLALRAEIFRAFAATGAPPELPDSPDLRALAERHVVVLDGDGRIRMAHPFAATRRRGAGRRGRAHVVGQLRLGRLRDRARARAADATITAQGIAVRVAAACPRTTGAVFDVAVPAARWWDDIADT